MAPGPTRPLTSLASGECLEGEFGALGDGASSFTPFCGGALAGCSLPGEGRLENSCSSASRRLSSARRSDEV